MNPPVLFALTQPDLWEQSQKVKDQDPVYVTGDNRVFDCLYRQVTPEESIVYMARVSSPTQRTENAEKLLLFLVKNSHWSPFDMVDMTVEIHTSRAIMAQILRHWSFRFQEFSQRYSTVPEDTNWNHVEARMKAKGGNRQGSGDVNSAHSASLQDACMTMEDIYQQAIEHGVAPESARMVLPLATPTRAYMKGPIRSWMTYFWQRCDPHAQKEHRELAEQLFEIFKKEFPIIAGLVEKYKPRIMCKNLKRKKKTLRWVSTKGNVFQN